jgi:hypothetical protein
MWPIVLADRDAPTEALAQCAAQRLQSLLGIAACLKQARNFQRKECVYLRPSLSSTGRCGTPDSAPSSRAYDGLRFESRFASGNLARADRVGERIYSLLLNADTNSHEVQWFYFAVLGMRAGVEYRFLLDNFDKPDSNFNAGMRPLVFCPRAARQHGVGWRRIGADISYVANPFTKWACEAAAAAAPLPCFTASMTVTLPPAFETPRQADDPLFFAYCFPYCVENLASDLAELAQRDHCVRESVLCKTIAGRACPVLEISDWVTVARPGVAVACTNAGAGDEIIMSSCGGGGDGGGKSSSSSSSSSNNNNNNNNDDDDDNADDSAEQQEDGEKHDSSKSAESPRDGSGSVGEPEGPAATDFASALARAWVPAEERTHVVLTARVHPGESNASWVMRGALDFLCGESETAQLLRARAVVIVVPMLNPDGVAAGNSRCNLAGLDLNRQWSRPDPAACPTVFALRALVAERNQARSAVTMFLDMHGHSRREGVFFFGCEDASRPGAPEELFPRLVQLRADVRAPGHFIAEHCNHKVSRAKNSSARVAVWRDLAIPHSFTLEASMSGSRDAHFSAADLERAGGDVARAVWDLLEPSQRAVRRVTHALRAERPERFRDERAVSAKAALWPALEAAPAEDSAPLDDDRGEAADQTQATRPGPEPCAKKRPPKRMRKGRRVASAVATPAVPVSAARRETRAPRQSARLLQGGSQEADNE